MNSKINVKVPYDIQMFETISIHITDKTNIIFNSILSDIRMANEPKIRWTGIITPSLIRQRLISNFLIRSSKIGLSTVNLPKITCYISKSFIFKTVSV